MFQACNHGLSVEWPHPKIKQKSAVKTKTTYVTMEIPNHQELFLKLELKTKCLNKSSPSTLTTPKTAKILEMYIPNYMK